VHWIPQLRGLALLLSALAILALGRGLPLWTGHAQTATVRLTLVISPTSPNPFGVALAEGALNDRAQSASIPGRWEAFTVAWQGEAHAVWVYRPAGYPAHAPYPVVYLLPGWAMGPGMWQRPEVEQVAEAQRLLLVAVEGEGSVPSYYAIYARLPWPDGPEWRVSFYDWFINGVVPWVERRYAVRREAGGRALLGFSMGGKGAFSLAAHRPDLFAAAVSFGGVMDLQAHGSQAVRMVYGPPEEAIRYAADNPLDLAPNLMGVRLFLFHGAADPEVSPEQGRRMHETLSALGYPHHWEEIPGVGHEIPPAALARAFAMLGKALREPRPPPPAWRYRFAMALRRTIYGWTLVKTRPEVWSEILQASPEGFMVRTHDALTVITPSLYPRRARVRVQILDAERGSEYAAFVRISLNGRLRLTLPPGSWWVILTPLTPQPTSALSAAGPPGAFLRRPGCPEEDVPCYRIGPP